MSTEIKRPLCKKCKKNFVYCDPSAVKGEWCEPCYWEWQDAGKPTHVTRIEHKEKRRVFRSRWEKRGAGGN
jgi:transposase-like protein